MQFTQRGTHKYLNSQHAGENVLHIVSRVGNANYHHMNTTMHPTVWLKLNRLTAPMFSKQVEQLKSFYNAGECKMLQSL